MTTTNPTTNWHLSQMPNLIETLRQLSNAGVEIIGISSHSVDPLYLEIHCHRDDNFREWMQRQDWMLTDRHDDTYPMNAECFLNNVRVFALLTKEEMEKWGEGDNA